MIFPLMKNFNFSLDSRFPKYQYCELFEKKLSLTIIYFRSSFLHLVCPASTFGISKPTNQQKNKKERIVSPSFEDLSDVPPIVPFP